MAIIKNIYFLHNSTEKGMRNKNYYFTLAMVSHSNIINTYKKAFSDRVLFATSFTNTHNDDNIRIQ